MAKAGDCRSLRILLVGDLAEEGVARLSSEGGFGLIQLPPAGMSAESALPSLIFIADQIEDYLKHGYEVRLLRASLPWAQMLREMLLARGLRLSSPDPAASG